MSKTNRKAAPFRNQESKLNYLVNLAFEDVEERLKKGTASSQIITTLLHMGTVKFQLELEKLRTELQVANAKIEDMESQRQERVGYDEVLKALKSYQGINEEEDPNEEYY